MQVYESHCSDHTSSAAPRRPPSGTSILCWLNISRLTHQRVENISCGSRQPAFFLGGPSSLAGHGPTRFARRWPTPAAFLCPVRFQIRIARPLQRAAGSRAKSPPRRCLALGCCGRPEQAPVLGAGHPPSAYLGAGAMEEGRPHCQWPCVSVCYLTLHGKIPVFLSQL